MDLLRKAFLGGYATETITVSTVLVCLITSAVLSGYIYFVYRRANRNAFYNRSFNLSLIGMSLITSAIILTIQSNIVVSLGTVGALSIVRFRTAIKNPLDLVFLFWSISVGIICGAGFALIAVLVSVLMTIVILVFKALPETKDALVLVVNADGISREEKILEIAKKNSQHMKVRARTATTKSLNIVVEVRGAKQKEMLEEIMAMEGIANASLVEHDGDVTV